MSKIRVRPETGKLYIDFFYRGVRCREQTDLIHTSENRKKVERLLTAAERAIADGSFVYANFFPGSPKATRLETRCPGADINPYLATAAVVAAGLHGVEKGLKLTTPPITGTNQGAENIPRAPRSLIETTRIFQGSDIARDWFGDLFVDHFAATREWEWRQWQDAVTDWELKRYFEII